MVGIGNQLFLLKSSEILKVILLKGSFVVAEDYKQSQSASSIWESIVSLLELHRTPTQGSIDATRRSRRKFEMHPQPHEIDNNTWNIHFRSMSGLGKED